MNSPDPGEGIRRGDWMRCRSLSVVGRVERLLADADGNIVCATLEADGGGWITVYIDDLTPIRRRNLN